MSITTLRTDLEEIRALIESNQAKQALDKLNLALADLDQEKPQAQSSNGHVVPLPTAEQQSQQDEQEFYLDAQDAVRWLGIASEAKLRNLVLSQSLKHKFDGDRILVPLDELERIEHSQAVQDLREAKRAADQKRIEETLSIPEGEDDPYLPSEVAAKWLDIGSDIELWFNAQDKKIKYKQDGKLLLIPLSELRRIDHTNEMRRSRELHYVNEQLATLGWGSDEPLTQEEMDELSAFRPFERLPWAA